MATVCRLSRSVLFPPQFKSLQEWFHYAFASSEIDGMCRYNNDFISFISSSLQNYIIFIYVIYFYPLSFFRYIAVDRFPCVERDRMDSMADNNASRGRSTSATSGKLQEHSHTREVIFALPSLQLHLKTEHLQTARTPDVIGKLKKKKKNDFLNHKNPHILNTRLCHLLIF